MLYLPDTRYMNHFKILAWSLPPKLLPCLYDRGLGIYVLPPEEAAACEIVYKRLRLPRGPFCSYDTRLPHLTPHYQFRQKFLILPYHYFFGHNSARTFLHEIGHAVDGLYYDNSRLLSDYPLVRKYLRVNKPFSEYCKTHDAATGRPLEQFATGFAAFFLEPSDDPRITTIEHLSPGLIEFIKERLITPFEE